MILRILPKQITALQSIFHFSPSVRGSTFHMLQHIGIYNRDQRDSRFSRILENFHFLVSISKHFDFTLHFSKKSESIFFHFAVLEKEWKLFIFTSRISKTHSRWSLRGAGIINTYNLLSVGKPLLLWPDQLSGCFGDSLNGCTLDDSVVYLGCSTNQLVVQLE